MNIVLVMLPVALGLVLLAVLGFIRAARRGQFDDLDTPPLRVVSDQADEPEPGR